MLVEAPSQELRVGRRGALPCHDHEVERCEVELPERLARQALQAVPVDGPFRRSPRDSQAQPRVGSSVWSGEHGEEAIC